MTLSDSGCFPGLEFLCWALCVWPWLVGVPALLGEGKWQGADARGCVGRAWAGSAVCLLSLPSLTQRGGRLCCWPYTKCGFRGENRSNPHLTLKDWCLIRLQLPGQVSQEHRLVEIALVDVLWVSSVAALSGVFIMKGVKLTARSLSFAVSDSKGSSLPNHHPFLWKERFLHCYRWLEWFGLTLFPPQSKLHSLCCPTWAHWFPASVSPLLQSINAQWHVLKLNKSGTVLVVVHQAKLPLALTFNAYEKLRRQLPTYY